MLKKSLVLILIASIIYLVFCVVGFKKKIKHLQASHSQDRTVLITPPASIMNSVCNVSKDTLKFDDFYSESKILLLPRENSALYTWKIDTVETKLVADKTSRGTGRIYGELRHFQEFDFFNRSDDQNDDIKFYLTKRFLDGQHHLDSLTINF